MSPPKDVLVLMKRLQEQNEALGVSTIIENNVVQHQKKNSECCMYCMYFIIKRLEGKTMTHFLKRIKDDNVEKQRKILFFKEL